MSPQDQGGFYDRGKLFWKGVEDATLMAACAPPGGGRQDMSSRFIRHMHILCMPPTSEVGHALAHLARSHHCCTSCFPDCMHCSQDCQPQAVDHAYLHRPVLEVLHYQLSATTHMTIADGALPETVQASSVGRPCSTSMTHWPSSTSDSLAMCSGVPEGDVHSHSGRPHGPPVWP